MPFLHIMGLESGDSGRRQLARRLTGVIVDSLAVDADSVTIYFAAHDRAHYAHGGEMSSPTRRRIFVNLHILARDVGLRRAVAAGVCAAIADVTGCEPRNIAVYFHERAPDEVAHAGILESERKDTG